jgi:hypothetical protein
VYACSDGKTHGAKPNARSQPLLVVNGSTDRWFVYRKFTTTSRTDFVYNAAANPFVMRLSNCNDVAVEIYDYS